MNRQEYYCFISENSMGKHVSENDVHDIFTECQSKGITIIDIESEHYPDSLRFIDDPPKVLFCKGNISILNDKSRPYVSVVGTRRASSYGKWVASEIGRTLSRCGAIHISGMAEGIDAAGHRAVISNGGQSIAVLGTGIDVCFPKSSSDIYNTLQLEGLVITEYTPGASGHPSNFPRRNRIISGLSNKVVIVEGALKSGSMITAHFALDQGKEIYAVPGNINQANSIGPNRLIEDGAIPIADPSGIAETLGIGLTVDKLTINNLRGIYAKIYDLVNVSRSIRIEDIIGEVNDTPDSIMAALTVLELAALIHNDCGIIRII